MFNMIGIIFLLNLEYAPFLKKYTKELEAEGKDFEIIYWNRLQSETYEKWNTVVYEKKANLSDNKFQKMISFYKYRKFLKKTLKEKKYEKVIVLTTLTGMLIFDILLKKYRNKFIYDIRDYTFEKNYIYKFIENIIIKSSYFVAISSDGFREFLPKSSKYILSHNIVLEEVERSKNFKRQISSKVNLTFIGAVRHFEIDKEVVDIFGNDSRYEVFFHGFGLSYSMLKKYCVGKFSNVFVTGKYNRNEKEKLLYESSVINSYYAAEKFANKFALPNKYYDTLIYKIPLWANPDVYVGERAIENGIGLNVKLNKNAPDEIFNLLNSMDWDTFDKNCDKELDTILKEDKIFVQKVKEFINMQS